jgi:hypothetical protein
MQEKSILTLAVLVILLSGCIQKGRRTGVDMSGLDDSCLEIFNAMDRDLCWGGFADSTGEVAYCDLIIGSLERNGCYLKLAKDLPLMEYCEIISDESMKDECIYTVASRSDNRTLCDMIVEEKWVLKCENKTTPVNVTMGVIEEEEPEGATENP